MTLIQLEQRTFDKLIAGSLLGKTHADLLQSLTKNGLISEAEAMQTAKKLVIQILQNAPAYTLPSTARRMGEKP